MHSPRHRYSRHHSFIVAQATPSLELTRWLQKAAPVWNSHRFKRWRDRLRTSWGWLVTSLGLVLMLLWNWPLILSLGLGMAILVWVYLARQGWWAFPWQGHWQKLWPTLWQRSNRSLTLAVFSGVMATVGSYLAIAIWLESEQSWMATGTIVQAGMTLAVLLLLIWQQLNRNFEAREEASDRATALLTQLADGDPLKRLLAVRQLTQQAQTCPQRLPIQPTYLVGCFRLMLNRETEPALCSALLDSIRILNTVKASSQTASEMAQLEASRSATLQMAKQLSSLELEGRSLDSDR